MELVMNTGKLALNDVPILQIGGTIDPAYGQYASAIEGIYHQLGGRISTMIKEGYCHHPHSLINPKPIADFIESSFYSKKDLPSFVSSLARYRKMYYYSLATSYTWYADEQVNITTRGALFSPCYERYEIYLPKVQGFSNVIVPKKPAPGNPWIFRADYVQRDAVVDQELLAKGYYIVTAATPYTDGPSHADWDAIYTYLTAHGFAKKAVIEGSGQATGEMYAWAIENPDKVSCIYGQNPILTGRLVKVQPLDNLAPLAKAGIPIMHICGSLDPDLDKQTRVAEKRYKQLDGKITVIIKQGQGHYFIPDAKPAVAFITANTKN
jgi:pimeloyl-ACP methyl ester carboxylesterase